MLPEIFKKQAREDHQKKGKGKCRGGYKTKDKETVCWQKCLFFWLQGNKGQAKYLHEFKTLDADENVRATAAEIQDNKLLGRIAGDMIALKAKYHLSCLTSIRNCHCSIIRQKQSSPWKSEENKMVEARVFTDLVSFTEHALEKCNFCFRSPDLHHK